MALPASDLLPSQQGLARCPCSTAVVHTANSTSCCSTKQVILTTLQPPVEQHRSCQQSSVGGQQSHSARLVFEVVVALLCRCFWLS